MIQDIAFLVANTPLHGHGAEDIVDGCSEGLAAVQDDQDALLDVKAPGDEIGEEMDGDGLFSVEPSQSPSGIFTPSVLTPKATTQQRPFSSIPSSISAANRTSESERAIRAARCSPVRATNSRLTVDFDVERSAAATASPTGSRVLERRRVETPASICSSTTLLNGSRSAKCA